MAKRPTVRPKGWASWRALDGKQPYLCGEERLLYSDAEVRGSLRELGPFELINLCGGPRPDDEAARAVLAIRVAFHVNANVQPEDLVHGGSIGDEIAALVSLLLRVRLRAGDRTRTFRGKTEPGRPLFEAAVERPYLPAGHWTPILPRRDRRVDLDQALPLLRTYPSLEAEDANALVRAARLYQQALWFSEREPRTSWLQFVSAAETIAVRAFAQQHTEPEEALREVWPDVADLLKDGNAELRTAVAKRVAQLAGANLKFRRLFEQYRPPPPRGRPKEDRAEWNGEALGKMLRTVYTLRSRALHAGEPFPTYLCMAHGPTGRVAPERLPEVEREDLSRELGVKDREVPMLLHIFEHLVQGAIVRWWRSLARAPRRRA